MNDQPSGGQGHEPADRRPIGSRSSWWAKAIAGWLARRGASPNGISVVGMLGGVGAGVLFLLTSCDCGPDRALWAGGVALITVRLLANMFDGMVAVSTGKTSPVGELFNEVPDRVSDAVTLIGAGYAVGGDIALGYGAAAVALFVAYVRTMGKGAGLASDFRGPMAKQQRMAVVGAGALFMAVAPGSWQFTWGPDGAWGVVSVALWVVIGGGIWTAVRRLIRASRELKNRDL